MSYTPGPWEWDGYGITHNEKDVVGVSAGQDLIISEADANLIAAAPDLLEACKELFECTKGSAWVDGELFDQIETAIDKAEGKDSGACKGKTGS